MSSVPVIFNFTKNKNLLSSFYLKMGSSSTFRQSKNRLVSHEITDIHRFLSHARQTLTHSQCIHMQLFSLGHYYHNNCLFTYSRVGTTVAGHPKLGHLFARGGRSTSVWAIKSHTFLLWISFRSPFVSIRVRIVLSFFVFVRLGNLTLYG